MVMFAVDIKMLFRKGGKRSIAQLLWAMV